MSAEGAADAAGSFDKRELLGVTLRFVAGLLLMLLLVALLGQAARDWCEGVARGFVTKYGYAGMALGTFLADGVYFPIPPQFYMLLAVASGASTVRALLAIGAASLLAGVVGFYLARWLGAQPWILARTERTRRLLQSATRRYGLRSALYASLLPVPYSVLCYLAGLNRAPRAFLMLLCACRVPKLLAFYGLIQLGW